MATPQASVRCLTPMISSKYVWGNSESPQTRPFLKYPDLFGRVTEFESVFGESSITASEGLVRGDSKHSLHLQERGPRQVTIDMLPDDALLEIFDFCRAIGTSDTSELEDEDEEMENSMWWKTLVHVCQRWRKIIFTSPRRLDLHVTCSHTTPTKTSLDIWPPFPIKIWYHPWMYGGYEERENIVAALEHHDRIDDIIFSRVTEPTLQQFVATMQEPLVALTNLKLTKSIFETTGIILPDAFFSVSAPSLRSFSSSGISFPSLPNFITSARHLVDLHLGNIPVSGYIAPVVIVASLTALPNLKRLFIGFKSPQLCLIEGNPPPPPRAIFPALTFFSFGGISKYLNDFVARIDTPLLNRLHITLRNPIRHTQHLYQFFARTETLKLFNRAQVALDDSSRKIILGGPSFDLEVEVYNSELMAPMITRVCGTFSSLISCVERLDIVQSRYFKSFPRNLAPGQLLELFRQFSAVQSLYVSGEMKPLVISALRESTGDDAKGVLPALRELFLEKLEPSGSLWEAIQSFVATRQLSDHPITVQHWEPKSLKQGG